MRAALLLALVTLLAPLAQAHGATPEEPYDPLALDAILHADAGLALGEARPEPGHAWFRPGEPNQPHPALDLTWNAPSRLLVEKEARVTLAYAMDKPMAPADRAGDSFEISLHVGEGAANATAKVKISQTSLGLPTTSGPAKVEATLALDKPVALARGEALTLRIRPLMPVVPPEGLRLLLGGDAATTLALPLLRLPSVADLHLQDALVEEHLLSADPGFATGAAAVYHELRVDHEKAELRAGETAQGRKAFLLLRGVESSADAHAHHTHLDPATRAGAAHHYQVGERLVRVHPGVLVKVPLAPGPDGLTTTVKCVLNCPKEGFEASLALLAPDDPQGATGGTLIPPPRSTKGVPVSGDAPQEEKNMLPLAPPLPLAALALAALLAPLAARRR